MLNFHLKLLVVLALALWTPLNRSSLAAAKDGGFVVYPNVDGNQGSVVFSHASHGSKGAGYGCGNCHPNDESFARIVTMEDIRRGRECGACHDGRSFGPRSHREAPSIQNCSSCHMPLGETRIKLNRMDPAVFSHSRHLGANSNIRISRPTGFSCIDCHPPFERAPKSSVRMRLPHEEGGCARCHNGHRPGKGLPTAFAATTRCLTCHRSP
jgi:c(7)-type cytochrome triheme protein